MNHVWQFYHDQRGHWRWRHLIDGAVVAVSDHGCESKSRAVVDAYYNGWRAGHKVENVTDNLNPISG